MLHPTLVATIVVRIEDYFVPEEIGIEGAKQKLIKDFSGRFPVHYPVVSVTVEEELP